MVELAKIRVQVVVTNPNVIVDAGPDQQVCVLVTVLNLAGSASVIESPGSIQTFSNTQTENLMTHPSSTDVNVNIQTLNMTNVQNSILEVCVEVC